MQKGKGISRDDFFASIEAECESRVESPPAENTPSAIQGRAGFEVVPALPSSLTREADRAIAAANSCRADSVICGAAAIDSRKTNSEISGAVSRTLQRRRCG